MDASLRSVAFRCSAVACCLILGSIELGRAEEPDAEAKSRALRARVLNAKSVEASEKDWKKYLGHYEKDVTFLFDALQLDDDDSIALQGAFASRLTLHRSSNVFHLNPEGAKEFFAFFEGRTRIPIPSIWRNQKAGFGDVEKATTHVVQKYEGVEWKPGGIGFQVAGGGKKTVLSIDARVSVKFEDEFIDFSGVKVPAKALQEKLRATTLVVQRSRDEQSLFIANHDETMGAFGNRLICVDAEAKQIRWTSEVWGARYRVALGGFAQHDVEVVETKEAVTVFGAGTFGAFAESFSIADGAVRFRFSTDACGFHWRRRD